VNGFGWGGFFLSVMEETDNLGFITLSLPDVARIGSVHLEHVSSLVFVRISCRSLMEAHFAGDAYKKLPIQAPQTITPVLLRGVWSGEREVAVSFHSRSLLDSVPTSLIFWPGQIVFNPKMTIFIQINREIKK
jgi:hypothetical protein